MDKTNDILFLVYALKNSFIYRDCLGCKFNYPSQHDHFCCFLTEEEIYDYKVEALYYMLANNSITPDEFDQVYSHLNVSSSA
jgi:hypothetical protein